jgi:hypothetical protein
MQGSATPPLSHIPLSETDVAPLAYTAHPHRDAALHTSRSGQYKINALRDPPLLLILSGYHQLIV